jgi:hypothetical protein
MTGRALMAILAATVALALPAEPSVQEANRPDRDVSLWLMEGTQTRPGWFPVTPDTAWLAIAANRTGEGVATADIGLKTGPPVEQWEDERFVCFLTDRARDRGYAVQKATGLVWTIYGGRQPATEEKDTDAAPAEDAALGPVVAARPARLCLVRGTWTMPQWFPITWDTAWRTIEMNRTLGRVLIEDVLWQVFRPFPRWEDDRFFYFYVDSTMAGGYAVQKATGLIWRFYTSTPGVLPKPEPLAFGPVPDGADAPEQPELRLAFDTWTNSEWSAADRESAWLIVEETRRIEVPMVHFRLRMPASKEWEGARFFYFLTDPDKNWGFAVQKDTGLVFLLSQSAPATASSPAEATSGSPSESETESAIINE